MEGEAGGEGEGEGGEAGEEDAPGDGVTAALAGGDQRVHVGPALCGVWQEAALEGAAQPAGQLAGVGAAAGGLAGVGGGGAGGVGADAEQGLVEGDAEAVLVAAGVGGATLALLRAM